MNNQSYWEKRAALQMYEYMEEAEELSNTLLKAYEEACNDIQKDAKRIFRTYNAKYSLSKREANLLLKQMKNPADLNELITRLKDDPKNKDLIKQIEGQAYGSRLARLSSLFEQIENVVTLLYAQQQREMSATLTKLAEKAYYDSIFDLQQYSGYGFNFKMLNKKDIQRALNIRWYGENYSERIWGDREQLIEKLKIEIIKNLLTGAPLRTLTQNLQDTFDVSYNDARRLARTESCFTASQMRLKGYESSGVEKYIYVAILDLRTSTLCRGLDGKIFLVEEATVGKNYPPMHPWCRSTTIAYVPKELLQKMKRTAVDPETGEKIKIPADMTYQQWYEKYVKGKSIVEAKEKAVKNQAADKRQFERYKEVLKDEIPKELADFQEIKYNNQERYNILKRAYRIVNQYENNSGNMEPMKIVELHDEAVRNKALLTGDARRKGNQAIMQLDGNFYIANSQINEVYDPGYYNFKGDKNIIALFPRNRIFKTKVIGHDRKVDGEYKLFELAATFVNDGKHHKLELLSEKNMCNSCKDVMTDFTKKFPNTEVSAVSLKEENSKTTHNRNSIFEVDVKKRVENNANKKR